MSDEYIKFEDAKRRIHWSAATPMEDLYTLPTYKASEDCISRAELLKDMEELNVVSFYELDENSKDAYYELVDAVKGAPSVIPSRPRGEWIEYRDESNGGLYGRCSLCGKGTLYAVSYDIKGNRYTMNFCPNCGAGMRGDEK